MPHLPTADPYLPGHGDPSYSVRHYDLDLDYVLVGNRLAGDATLAIEVLEPTRRLVLDLAGLVVAKVRVTGARLKKFSTRDRRLVLDLHDLAPAGAQLTVAIRYSGTPKPIIDKHHGDAGWEELEDGVIVAAQPHGAPTWFPCNDRASDKATYAITLSAPAGYQVVANGRLMERVRKASVETWSYAMDRPMAPYLATVQIGRYVDNEHPAVEQGDPAVRTFAPAGANLAGTFDQQPAMLAFFTRVFGPYPFDSYVAVVTDDELEIPLESQGLSTFGRNFLTTEWSHYRLIAHELAHQWFGNAVTYAQMKDVWLHEGFACYAEWLWSEECGGPRTCDEWARHHHARLDELEHDLVLADPGPADMFDDRVYKRGALALQALRVHVGDDSFFAMLRGWVAEHAGGSVTTDDFLSYASRTTGRDARGLLSPWLYDARLPPYPR